MSIRTFESAAFRRALPALTGMDASWAIHTSLGAPSGDGLADEVAG
jgi:hypothetical protein